jgi:pimeloyl-ACP methyl ester carboxylesterase
MSRRVPIALRSAPGAERLQRWSETLAGIALSAAMAVVALVATLSPASAFDRYWNGPATGYSLAVASRNGAPVNLHIEDTGRGPPLVLLHGLGASSYMWRLVTPALAATHRVIAIDLKGFGRSDKTFDLAYATEDQAALVIGVIRALALTNVTLVGHSFGGNIALMTVLMANGIDSRRISRLVLLNAPALPQPASSGVALLNKPILPYVMLNILPPQIPTALGLLSEATGMGHITETDIRFYAAPLSDVAGRHALIQSARQIAPADADGIIRRYPRIQQPVLVVGCREDRTVPISTAVRMARILPRARLRVLEGCDHIPPEQTPGAVIDLLQRFR